MCIFCVKKYYQDLQFQYLILFSLQSADEEDDEAFDPSLDDIPSDLRSLNINTNDEVSVPLHIGIVFKIKEFLNAVKVFRLLRK